MRFYLLPDMPALTGDEILAGSFDNADYKLVLTALRAWVLNQAVLTGNATAVTQAPGDNSTKVATTAFIATALANLINAAPGALDTLDELAAALGDDPNFATTITNALTLKANSADLGAVATSNDYNDLDNLPTLAAVAGTGAYADLAGKPTLGTAAATAASDYATAAQGAKADAASPRDRVRSTATPAAGVLTVDLSLGPDFAIPMTANVTSTSFTNGPAAGCAREGTLIFTQDATGGRTWAPPAGAKWPNGLAAVLTSTANAVDHIGYRIYNNAGVLEYTFYPVRDVR